MLMEWWIFCQNSENEWSFIRSFDKSPDGELLGEQSPDGSFSKGQ
jgi:competence protein ComGF